MAQLNDNQWVIHNHYSDLARPKTFSSKAKIRWSARWFKCLVNDECIMQLKNKRGKRCSTAEGGGEDRSVKGEYILRGVSCVAAST